MSQGSPHRWPWSGALLALALLACPGTHTVGAQPQLFLVTKSVDFGGVPVLNQAVLTLQVRNDGRADLTLTGAAIAEAGAPFTVQSAAALISGGNLGDILLTFTPPEETSYSATLVFSSNDPDQPSLSVPLTGKGSTAAKMEADAQLDFGQVCEGSEAIKSFAIRSTGTAALLLEDLRFADGTAPEFQFVSSTRTPATVASGSEVDVAIRFAPTATSAASLSGSVEIQGTDPAARHASVPLHAKVNRAPLAVIADLPNPAPGATIQLDGSGSSDPDGNLPLSYAWSLKSSPIGSKSQPTPVDQPLTSLTLDLPGQYTVALRVQDAAGCQSAPAFKDVLAKPAQQLVVEVVWDNLDADLDLHLAPYSDDFFGPTDCYYADGHTTQNWGGSGGPSLDRDALVGYGPEIITWATPVAGQYKVMVDYFSDHNAKNPPTAATLRVYEFGVVKAELKGNLYSQGQQWRVLVIDWPSGTITNINEVGP